MRRFFVVALFLGLFVPVWANDAGQSSVSQTIEGFKLSGFNPDGSKDWDLNGKTAYIEDDVMRFDKIEGHGYSKEDIIKVSSDKGLYNQRTGNLLLSENVIAQSKTGAKIITDKAMWDTASNTIHTDSHVVAIKGASIAQSNGAQVKIDENSVDMKKDVVVQIERMEGNKKVKTSITCDGPLQVNYEKKTAVFNNNVVVHDKDAVIYSDKLFVYFNNDDNKITDIVAKGNVRIIKGDNETKGQEAHYNVSTQELVMTGRPTVLFYGEDGQNALAGN